MTFGLMLHHFVDETDAYAPPGALSAEEFRQLLHFLDLNYTILSPGEYEARALSDSLGQEDICLTFDDALKSQIDIAGPILDEFGIRAFFFVYSGAFGQNPPLMEFARDFRSGFSSTDDYYAEFFAAVEREEPVIFGRLETDFPDDYLRDYPFYSRDDRRYRFMRDHLLKDGYDDMVLSVMRSHGYEIGSRRARIFMSDENLSELANKGHTLGLHSTSHPMRMEGLDRKRQEREFAENLEHLSSISSDPITSMSHPCGNYGAETLDILTAMGIRVGFRSSMTRSESDTLLEIPREDHILMMKRMKASEGLTKTV